MKAGASRVVLALFAITVVFAACGEQQTASVGAGLRLAPLPTTTTTAPPGVAVALDARAPLPASAAARRRLPSGSHARVAHTEPLLAGRINIPKIDLDLATYEGVDPWTLRHGPGHWAISAAPGQVGNTVFAGHRTTYSRPFHDIDLLEIGDEVTFVTDAGVFTYATTSFFVVDEFDSWIADPTDTPTFTLFACHPKGSERQRYVVKGELVRAHLHTPPPEPVEQEPPAPSRQPRSCLLCGGSN